MNIHRPKMQATATAIKPTLEAGNDKDDAAGSGASLMNKGATEDEILKGLLELVGTPGGDIMGGDGKMNVDVAAALGKLDIEFKGLLSESMRSNEEDDADIAELREMTENGFDLRCAWGQRFRRSPEHKSAGYQGLNRADKAQFRKDWAATKLSELQYKKTKVMSYQKIDKTVGKYLPFYRVWEAEGGPRDPGALEASLKHCRRCVMMGPPFISMNGMTDRLEFLHIERSRSEVFSKCWSMFMTETSQESTPKKVLPATAGSPEKTSEEASTGKEGQEEMEDLPENPEQVPERSKDVPKPPKPQKTKTPLELAISEANDIKKTYSSAMTSARSVLDAIEVDDSWQPFAGIASPLRKAVQALSGVMTTFAREFLSQEMKQIRRRYDEPTLISNLKSFSAHLLGKVEAVDIEAKRMIAMHHARAATG